jgi:hypothetical protein
MNSSSTDSLLGGVDYDPLLASWPETHFDQELLDNAPVEARALLRRAYAGYKSGYTEGSEMWGEWFALFEKRGQQNEGVRVSLLGLLFLRHEARHHLDFYSTPLGWSYPSLVAGLYFRLQQLAQARPGTAESEEIASRLRRALRVHALWAGNVPRLDKQVWGDVWLEKEAHFGVIRYRRDNKDPGVAIATVQPRNDIERAVSVNSILEARAIVETSGHMAGSLRDVGASEVAIAAAIELLLELCVQISRDDYWVVLRIGLPALDFKEASRELAKQGPRREALMLTTWFALHVEPPQKELDVPSIPTLRALLALREFFKFSDKELANPKVDWSKVLEQLSIKIGGHPLAETAASCQNKLHDLQETLNARREFTGLAREHLLFLVNTAREGFALRSRPIAWVDNVGWPNQEDPQVVVNWSAAPPTTLAAWSRLTRIQNLLRTDAAPSDMKELASSFF